MSTIADICHASMLAQRTLSTASTVQKNAVLLSAAKLLMDQCDTILEANNKDLHTAETTGLSPASIDRLKLSESRLSSISQSLEEIVALPDPVGEISQLVQRPNGLRVGRMRIPLGVIAIIFESRPNVVIDAGALCFKSGNASILKGGKEAHHSNIALASILQQALQAEGLSANTIQLLTDRNQVGELLKQSSTVDLVIPRGGEGLIRYVTENSQIPVVQHYKGVCHVYVDGCADIKMASDIAFNSKVQRPGVCNAMETLLVHEDIAPKLLPDLFTRMSEAGVEIRGCPKTQELIKGCAAATKEDWSTEYLSLILSIRIVNGMDQAIEHIETYGSRHTESIVTSNYTRANTFVQRNPSSAVVVNASTRFNDGGQLGLGAEIGISTSRLHAYGPMGLEELTTRKFVVYGDGQIRQ